jgi:hypothetical protein
MSERIAVERNFEPTILRDLNRSGFQARREFEFNKVGGKLQLLKKCADARVHCILPAEDTAHFTTIAAADPRIFKQAYIHPSYGSIIDFTHFAGGTGEFPPSGCGGYAEWLKLMSQGSENVTELQSYVMSEISTADPLLASFQDAMAIATMTDKPVFFGSLDHLTAQLYISGLAVNLSGTPNYYSSVDFNNYNPQAAYANGFPVLDPGQIQNREWAQELERINTRNTEQQRKIFQANPHFTESQRVQNPPLIFVTDQPHSLRLIIPEVADLPNSDFALRVVKTKLKGQPVTVDTKKVIAQLEYPIGHSVKAQDEGSGPFHDSKQLLITTENIELSQSIAKDACRQPYMKPWLDRGGRIIVAGVKKGWIDKPSDIAFYRP